MKLLTKLLLIHWHHYQLECIAFDRINFMTGKTAAGKSTIIDALQLVLLGETGGSFFNKAANQKSARTLKSYLFGEKGDDGDVGFNYIRQGDFTSYVAIECFDDEKKQAFTAGIVCDCRRDQTFDSKWFIVNRQGLPQTLFIDEKTNTPLDQRQLKAYLTQTAGRGNFEFCDTNRRYQQVLLAKFGQLKDRYRTLLKKAVPFSPIADIEQFITESICEVKNPVDIGHMQNNIRQYKNLENDARIMEERIARLRRIEQLFGSFAAEAEKLRQQTYIVDRAAQEECAEREAQLRQELDACRTAAAAFTAEAGALAEQLAALRAERDAVRKELLQSDVNKKAQELQARMKSLEDRLAALARAFSALLVKTRGYGQKWRRAFAPLARVEAFDAAALDAALARADAFANVTEDALPALDFGETARQCGEFSDRLAALAGELARQTAETEAAAQALRETIARLERGVKPYDRKLLRLKACIEAALKRKYGKEIEVAIFAELLEIRDPTWSNAIEGYLDKQKFYLLVDAAYFSAALDTYSSIKKAEGISEFGLVDIGKLRKAGTQVLARSLAEEIETKHPDARLYADYLLGRVVKCAQAGELRQHRTAITADCMLYKNFVARQIDARRWANPYIGRASLEVQLRNKRALLEEHAKRLEALQSEAALVAEAKRVRLLERSEAESALQIIADAAAIPAAKEALEAARKEYDALDLSYIARLEERGRALDCRAVETEAAIRDKEAQKTKQETHADIFEKEKIPAVQAEFAAAAQKIAAKYDAAWRESVGEPRFCQERKQRASAAVLRANFQNAAIGVTRSKMEQQWKALVDERADYNRDYKMPHDVQARENDAFANELRELDAVQLPAYVDRIRDARLKSYNQFRDDFLAKIKANIETVDQQLRELNASIRESVFGTDTYRFVKTPRGDYKRYYDMVMDPLLMDAGGYNLATDAFNEKYKAEIDELFRKLIGDAFELSAEKRAAYEKDIKKFTDYKTYLTFDLIVTNREGEEQRLSKTLLKKSGGETQIPFYLSLLASFSQVCRVRAKNSSTMRLILLDEAFSKMDGERIQESIRLLRRFGLQAIFSAPPEKIPDIAPFVDRNIVVFKDKDKAFTKYFEPRQLEAYITSG